MSVVLQMRGTRIGPAGTLFSRAGSVVRGVAVASFMNGHSNIEELVISVCNFHCRCIFTAGVHVRVLA